MNRDNRVYGYNEYKEYYGRGNKIDNRRRDMDGTQYTSNRTMAIRANARRNRAYVCQIQRYLIISFLAVLLTILGVILGSNLLASSQSKASNEVNAYKYYTSIQITPGQTLNDIAGIYMTDDYKDTSAYIEEVCMINHIFPDDIHEGEYLTVPYYSAEYLK